MDIASVLGISSIIIGFFNRFFPRARQNEELINTYELRLAEKEERIQKLEKEHKKRAKEKRRIIQSLKRSGLSTDKLVEKYNKPLNAILISYVTQVEAAGSGYYKRCKFVQAELERFNAKRLGGADFLIPPAKVPEWIKTRGDLESWFESEILKGRYCKLRFLILFDLRKEAFWKSYVPYKQKKPWNYTIGEVLGVEDLFTEKQINTIALGDIIRDGDIAWLASRLLSGDELEVIHKNQTLIEEKLGNPSLRELSHDSIVGELSTVLAECEITNPGEVAQEIIAEARFWSSRLK